MSDEQDPVVALALLLTVDKISITVSAKRTLKMGDDFKSFESSHSWSMSLPVGLRDENDEELRITPAVAKAAAHLYTPVIVGKVYTDLVVAGVMTGDEYKSLMKRGSSMYEALLTRNRSDHAGEPSQGNLPGA